MKGIVPTVAIAGALAITALVLLAASFLWREVSTWIASLSDRELAAYRTVCLFVTILCLGFVGWRMRKQHPDDEV